jgi:carbon storage regulator
MLVLSRKAGQRIVVGQNIVVTVLDVRGDRVKLGFVAPNDVSIHREEVHRRVNGERQAHAPTWPRQPQILSEIA